MVLLKGGLISKKNHFDSKKRCQIRPLSTFLQIKSAQGCDLAHVLETGAEVKKFNWEIFAKFSGLLRISELYLFLLSKWYNIYDQKHNKHFYLTQITKTNKQLSSFLFPIGHPRFFNQLSTGLDIVSMAGEWLTATANTNMFTYEIAPVFILMEHECLGKMREIIGFEGKEFCTTFCFAFTLSLFKFGSFSLVSVRSVVMGNFDIFFSPMAGTPEQARPARPRSALNFPNP